MWQKNINNLRLKIAFLCRCGGDFLKCNVFTAFFFAHTPSEQLRYTIVYLPLKLFIDDVVRFVFWDCNFPLFLFKKRSIDFK